MLPLINWTVNINVIIDDSESTGMAGRRAACINIGISQAGHIGEAAAGIWLIVGYIPLIDKLMNWAILID